MFLGYTPSATETKIMLRFALPTCIARDKTHDIDGRLFKFAWSVYVP